MMLSPAVTILLLLLLLSGWLLAPREARKIGIATGHLENSWYTWYGYAYKMWFALTNCPVLALLHHNN